MVCAQADAPYGLAYTVFDPNSKLTAVPSNYLTMSYELKERGEQGSTLEITQGDFSAVEDGQRRYQDSLGGGDMVLEGIKKLAEAQVQAK